MEFACVLKSGVIEWGVISLIQNCKKQNIIKRKENRMEGTSLQTGRRSSKKLLICSLLVVLMTVLMASTAMAAKSGWYQKGKKVYYYYTADDSGTTGKKATGLQKIGKKYFYFNKSGVLQTGWVSTEEGYRYFKTNGSLGTKGSMYTGLKTIGKYKYYFDKNGVVVTGLKTIKNKTYYFNTSKTIGTRGRSYINKWKTIKNVKYYFGSDGVMVKNGWVKKTYYMDENGEMLKNTVTPDGYLVGADGKKASTSKVKGWVKISGKWKYYNATKKMFLVSTWKTISGSKYYLNADGNRVTGWQTIGKYKYYFNSKGVMQTGWQTIKSKKYYFGTNGRMQTSTTVDGYIIDANGVATKDPNAKANILIIAGHGQGDSGATSKWGYESNYTRQFAKLIYNQLKSSGKVNVTYYKNGSTSYDCYQQNAKTFGSSGLNISSKITGKGTAKSQVVAGIKTNSNIPTFTDYDYVLEIHFNATIESAKDPNGDGSYKGVGFYINSYKKKYTLEKNIVSAITKLGFKQWGAGVFASSTLFNARICQELGVDYGLLETAFIDDGDDMTFYTKNKSKMAKAVANAIDAYFAE